MKGFWTRQSHQLHTNLPALPDEGLLEPTSGPQLQVAPE